MNLDLYHHDSWAEGLLREVDRKLSLVLQNQEKIMEELRAAVERNRNAKNSIIAALNGISALLKEANAKNDPAAVAQVIADLDATTTAMADAAIANTPAAPQATPAA